MSEPSRTAEPRIDGFDRAIITLFGLGIMIVMSALSDISLFSALVASAGFATLVSIYGRGPKRDHRHMSDRRSGSTSPDVVFGERAIAATLLDGVWIVNRIGQIVYANQAAHDILGPTTQGQRMTTVMRATAIQTLVTKALDQNKSCDIAYHKDTPTDMHLRVFASPIMPAGRDDPRYRHVLLRFCDETAFRKSSTMKGDFLANASHELKTPIASLLGYIETLRGHAKDDAEAREKFLVIMQKQAERMQRLIADLLSLRQIEQIEHIAPMDRANFAQATQRALDAVAPLAKKRNVSLDINPLGEHWVSGNEDELVQLGINIIDNAVKMSPDGAHVSVSLTRLEQYRPQDLTPPASDALTPDGTIPQTRMIVAPIETARAYIALQVTDEGPGFSQDHLPRIGERFYRVAGDRSSREKGTGLGLAIVKHIVMRHRGGLHVKTTAQKQADIFDPDAVLPVAQKTGTQFTALVPAARDH